MPVPQADALVVGGQPANVGEYPWHVAVYRKRRSNTWGFICGGSLIYDERTILSGM